MMESASLTERIEKCERILKENANSQIFAALADAYRAKGDLDQAFRICRQGLRVHPNYGPGHLVMAKISFERKMFDWAEQELEESVKFDGETRATQQLRVEIMIAKNQFADAETMIKKLRATGFAPLLIQELQQRLDRQRKESRRRKADLPITNPQIPDVIGPNPPKANLPKVGLPELLDRLGDFGGVKMIVCANHDGTAIDHRGQGEQTPAEAAAFGIEMCRNAQTTDALALFGEPIQIVVECLGSTIVIVRLTRCDLVIMGSKEMNLGSMRRLLEDLLDRLDENGDMRG